MNSTPTFPSCHKVDTLAGWIHKQRVKKSDREVIILNYNGDRGKKEEGGFWSGREEIKIVNRQQMMEINRD